MLMNINDGTEPRADMSAGINENAFIDGFL